MFAANELFIVRILVANKIGSIEDNNESIEKSRKLSKTRKLSKLENSKGKILSKF